MRNVTFLSTLTWLAVFGVAPPLFAQQPPTARAREASARAEPTPAAPVTTPSPVGATGTEHAPQSTAEKGAQAPTQPAAEAQRPGERAGADSRGEQEPADSGSAVGDATPAGAADTADPSGEPAVGLGSTGESGAAGTEPDSKGSLVPSNKPSSPATALPELKTVPADHPFAVLLNLESHWNHDSGYDAFANEDAGFRWGIGVSYDLANLGQSLTVVPELGFRHETLDAEGGSSERLESPELEAWDLLGAVSLRYRYLSWLGGHLRAQLGASATTIRFLDSQGTQFEDSAWAPFAGLGAGVDVEKSISRKISLGLIVEGGYIADVAPEYELNPERDVEDDAIPIREASLGELSRSGPYLRFVGVARF